MDDVENQSACLNISIDVTVAELREAIEVLEACTYDMGYDDGNGKHGSRVVFFQARARALALLGLEPMPDDDALKPGLRREEALAQLREWAAPDGDPEIAHQFADEILIGLIDDDEIRAAFEAVPKWYS